MRRGAHAKGLRPAGRGGRAHNSCSPPAPRDPRLLFAGDWIEGLDRAAQEEDVDLYIVDINTPRLDGLEFLRRVRGERGRAVTALVVSPENEEAHREGAPAAGATEFVAKPVERQRLLEVVGRQPGLRG